MLFTDLFLEILLKTFVVGISYAWKGRKRSQALVFSFFVFFRSSFWMVSLDNLGLLLTEEVGLYLQRHLRVRMLLSERNLEMDA